MSKLLSIGVIGISGVGKSQLIARLIALGGIRMDFDDWCVGVSDIHKRAIVYVEVPDGIISHSNHNIFKMENKLDRFLCLDMPLSYDSQYDIMQRRLLYRAIADERIISTVSEDHWTWVVEKLNGYYQILLELSESDYIYS